MQNMREVYAYCQGQGIKVFMDATRCVENAYFIKEREKAIRTSPSRKSSGSSSATPMAAPCPRKSDCITNIGGFLCMNDEDLFVRAREFVVVFEGMPSYGGMAGRDMEAMAIGLKEAMQEEYIEYRVKQVCATWVKS